MKEVTDLNEKQQAEQVKVNILAQYVKNISFDSPSAPAIFSEMKEAPKVDLKLDIQIKDTQSDQYEVTVAVKATALNNDKQVFSVDVDYSGLFELKDYKDEEQKKQILLIYCPNIIFPFLRRVVSDITRDAGFQPLMINPVDFAGLYMQQKNNPENDSEEKMLH